MVVQMLMRPRRDPQQRVQRLRPIRVRGGRFDDVDDQRGRAALVLLVPGGGVVGGGDAPLVLVVGGAGLGRGGRPHGVGTLAVEQRAVDGDAC